MQGPRPIPPDLEGFPRGVEPYSIPYVSQEGMNTLRLVTLCM